MKKTLITALLAMLPWCAVASEATFNYSVTPVVMPNADLEAGGEVSSEWLMASLSVNQQIDAQHSLGLALSASQQQWHFDAPVAWGGKTPWQDLNRLELSMPYRFVTADGWIFGLTPGVQYAAEAGADQGESINWGGNAYVAHYFSPRLMLGLGVSAWQSFDENVVFPFVLLNWQISDQLSLKNPFVAGPVGPAGLELSWKASSVWDFAAGGTWRSYQTRLASDNPIAANGILENNSVPLYVRAGYQFAPSTRVDFYAGAALNGEFKIRNQQGEALISESYATMPFLGLSLSGRF